MSSYYGYDEMEYFIEEYGDLDNELTQLKNAIENSVKDEIKTKIEYLEKENKKMRQELKLYRDSELDYNHEKMRIEREYKEKINEFKKSTINELLNEKYMSVFYPQEIGFRQKKCDKCNEQRYINYKTPLGRNASECCDCYSNFQIFIPKHKFATKIYINKEKNNAEYIFFDYSDCYETILKTSINDENNILDNMQYEKILNILEKTDYDKLCFFTNFKQCYNFCLWYYNKYIDKFDDETKKLIDKEFIKAKEKYL